MSAPKLPHGFKDDVFAENSNIVVLKGIQRQSFVLAVIFVINPVTFPAQPCSDMNELMSNHDIISSLFPPS